jgi:hypothetical protein
MKQQILIFLSVIFLWNNVLALDTLVPEIDSTFIEQTDSISADSLKLDQQQTKEETTLEPAGYNQLFMFGFLILGAVLVVWKFSGKGNY